MSPEKAGSRLAKLALGLNVNSHIDGGMVEESLRRGLLKRFREAKIEIAYYKSSQGVPSGSPEGVCAVAPSRGGVMRSRPEPDGKMLAHIFASARSEG